jgi:polyhydroxyalkanoate synthesis regulator phasin
MEIEQQRLAAAVGNAHALVNDLEGIIKANPAATGLAGDAVSFLQDTGQVVKEIAATLAKNPESPITPDEFRVVTDQLDKATGGSYNPATGAVIGRLPHASREDLDAALEVARRGREQAEALAERVAALEQRLAQLEAGGREDAPRSEDGP